MPKPVECPFRRDFVPQQRCNRRTQDRCQDWYAESVTAKVILRSARGYILADLTLHDDTTIRRELHNLSALRPRYWSYSETARRVGSYDYFQYPAMMVPGMLRDLIRTITEVDSKIRTVYDPFAGSGTVLTEAMFQARDFYGTDINPLAVLLCKMKAGPFLEDVLESKIEDLIDHVEHDRDPRQEADFPNIRKWFHARSIRELSAIRRGIRAEPSLWCRRFFWVALAETVRRCSNSRTSTYKLHTRDTQDIEARRNLSPAQIFEGVLTDNLLTLSEHRQLLEVNRLLWRGCYLYQTKTQLADARTQKRCKKEFDLLVTSPPYGDNPTTVPYGQHSYLPLQWIDLEDIDPNMPLDCLSTTHAIDARSLGGHRVGAQQVEAILKKSPTLVSTLAELRSLPADRTSRVAAFSRDLYLCIDPILGKLRQNAYMIFVIGNRRVGGIEIPTCQILREFLESCAATHVLTIDRSIPTKRMASKNSITRTMSREQILIFRKH